MSSSKFHVSLNVHDLTSTVSFLELLFGTKPALTYADYAKFELSEPDVVLSLAPTDVVAGPALNHLGFRLPTRESLLALQQRLATAGLSYESEESIACCHSRQTKFWTRDPAGNLWELYVLEESPECDAQPAVNIPPTASAPPVAKNTTWSHRLGEPIPERIPAADASQDEVVLEGTLNAELTPAQRSAILQESVRVLRLGGKLLLRGMTADRTLNQPPRLPGPAAIVEHVPTHHDVLAAVKDAGFVGLELVTFGETYCFAHAGAELRETKIEAWRPAPHEWPRNCSVIYRGPFAEVQDDRGVVFRRGERTDVDQQTRTRLQESLGAEQFMFCGAHVRI